MTPYIDLHTHQQWPIDEVITVYNQMLPFEMANADLPFSAGLHPWNADQLSLVVLSKTLDQIAQKRNLLAFGETGLDKICKVSYAIQLEVFQLHLQKAVQHNKPVIIHCVKAWEEVIKITNDFPNPKIIHGYNGGIELTSKLLQEGFSFSVGKAILNPKSKLHNSIQLIPISQLFCETDDSDESIQSIYQGIVDSLKTDITDLKAALYNNYLKISA